MHVESLASDRSRGEQWPERKIHSNNLFEVVLCPFFKLSEPSFHKLFGPAMKVFL